MKFRPRKSEKRLFSSYLIVSGELKPATAFMTGALKLSGDLSKAMALETVMKASRERGFHTMAGQMQR